MAFDTFLKIDKVPGESTDEKHKEWIELLSFNHGMAQPVSGVASTAGGRSAERVDIQDLSFTKWLDKASPKLYAACCRGDHIPSATIEMCRAGGDKMKYMEIKLEDVMVSSVGYGGQSGGGDFPTENVTISFGKIVWTYTQQDPATGKPKGNVEAGWDLKANKSV